MKALKFDFRVSDFTLSFPKVSDAYNHTRKLRACIIYVLLFTLVMSGFCHVTPDAKLYL